jgi:hypothetical protein
LEGPFATLGSARTKRCLSSALAASIATAVAAAAMDSRGTGGVMSIAPAVQE